MMEKISLLDQQITKAAIWSAVTAVVLTVVSVFLVYDAPEGSTHAEKVAWINANSGAFLTGWITQVALMLTLSAVFAATSWKVGQSRPLTGLLSGIAIAIAAAAFFITKFTEIWAIPLIAQTVAAGGPGSETAAQLLNLHSQSYPFTITLTHDYLGFWLYAVFALMVAKPLWGNGSTATLSAILLGVYGLGFHVFMAASLAGSIALAEINLYLAAVSLPLFIAVIPLGLYFRNTAQGQ